VLELDGVLAPEGLTLDLVETLRLLAPFGAGNPEPRFAVKAARIIAPRVVGQGHVSFRIAGASGGRVKAIAFRAADSELGHALLRNNGTPMHLAGTLRPDHWQGETNVQFVVDDGAELSRH
ncbi:MAG: single-stranded-DNA-specific exonuclease RecJ, partial [Rhodospirillaceae bacterium]|nr:single-stranded-DNA-specific exonuclease RecJ [Rhodospirillaceae bacterium]